MATNPIQWFPGHMAKTKRMMRECISDIDVIIELLDARIPESSRNPEISKLTEGKPKIILLNKIFTTIYPKSNDRHAHVIVAKKKKKITTSRQKRNILEIQRNTNLAIEN